MNRRTWFALSMILIMAMLLAACGGGAAEPTAAPEPTQAPAAAPADTPTEAPAEAPTDTPVVEAPTEAPMEEPTEAPMEEPTAAPAQEAAGDMVTLTVWADDTRAPALNSFAPQLEADYGVKLEVQELAFGDIRDNVKLAAPAGEGPDLFIGAHDWIGELYINGLLAPIDLGDKAQEFFQPALDLFTYDGQLVGLPYATENVAFFYNKDLVPEAPTTWDQVIEVSKQLQADGTATYGWAMQTPGDAYHFYPVMTAFGGYVFGTDADGNWDPSDVGLDSEGSLAAAQFLDQAVKDGVLVDGVDWDTMHVLFEGGDAAMIITGPWALPRLRDAGINYGIANLPSATQAGQPFLGGQGFFINQFSDNKLLAQTVATELLATPEVMQAMFDVDPRPSAYQSVRDGVDDPDFAAFAEAGANAIPMPTIPEMSAVWGPWGDAITLIFQQAEDPVAAFTNAAEQVRTAIEGS
jgi:maltose/maltodextrin transport system substrate-binding protein/arabinogalactan oligomer/maltooligosaccharide transport system substrate-binding protein